MNKPNLDHVVTVTFKTDDDAHLARILDLIVSLRGLLRPAVSLEYEVCKADEVAGDEPVPYRGQVPTAQTLAQRIYDQLNAINRQKADEFAQEQKAMYDQRKKTLDKENKA